MASLDRTVPSGDVVTVILVKGFCRVGGVNLTGFVPAAPSAPAQRHPAGMGDVSAQHQYRCSISSLVAGPPLLRTDRAGDKLWLFHPLGFPSSSTLTSNSSWGTQQDPLFLPFSLPPHLRQLPAQPRPASSTAMQAGSASAGTVLEGCLSCAAFLTSPVVGWMLQTPVCGTGTGQGQAHEWQPSALAALCRQPIPAVVCGWGSSGLRAPPQVAWLEQSCSSWGALGSKPELPGEGGCCWPLDLHAGLSSGVPVLNPRSHDGPGRG